jgi:hypothetical protein
MGVQPSAVAPRDQLCHLVPGPGGRRRRGGREIRVRQILALAGVMLLAQSLVRAQRGAQRGRLPRVVVAQLEDVFAEDLKYSRKIELDQWRRRGLFSQLLEILSLPVREQL